MSCSTRRRSASTAGPNTFPLSRTAPFRPRSNQIHRCPLNSHIEAQFSSRLASSVEIQHLGKPPTSGSAPLAYGFLATSPHALPLSCSTEQRGCRAPGHRRRRKRGCKMDSRLLARARLEMRLWPLHGLPSLSRYAVKRDVLYTLVESLLILFFCISAKSSFISRASVICRFRVESVCRRFQWRRQTRPAFLRRHDESRPWRRNLHRGNSGIGAHR
jgi:hypothetical protein